MALMDWRRARICWGVRTPFRSAFRWMLRIMVARARPMLPPRRRACDWIPCADAKGVSEGAEVRLDRAGWISEYQGVGEQ